MNWPVPKRDWCFVANRFGRKIPCRFNCGTFCRRWDGGGFLPTQIEGMAAWYRFNVGVSVSQWSDQSGNSRPLLQATGSNQPAVQADGSLLFDGVDNFMQTAAFTLDQPESVYALLKQVTWTGDDYIWDGVNNTSMALNQQDSTPKLRIFAGAALTEATGNLPVDTYAAVCAIYNGTSSSFRVNNIVSATGDAGASSGGGFTLGTFGAAAGNFANVQVKEVIIYSGAHTDSQQTKVINYLNGL